MTPVRIQRKRAKGWKLPASTVYVGRPTKWGNPYRIREADGDKEYGIVIPAITGAQAVTMYRQLLVERRDFPEMLEPLRGMNLACWCAPSAPCHADVLLELANLPRAEAVRRAYECARVPQ